MHLGNRLNGSLVLLRSVSLDCSLGLLRSVRLNGRLGLRRRVSLDCSLRLRRRGRSTSSDWKPVVYFDTVRPTLEEPAAVLSDTGVLFDISMQSGFQFGG